MASSAPTILPCAKYAAAYDPPHARAVRKARKTMNLMSLPMVPRGKGWQEYASRSGARQLRPFPSPGPPLASDDPLDVPFRATHMRPRDAILGNLESIYKSSYDSAKEAQQPR